jgi:hypothetical protein
MSQYSNYPPVQQFQRPPQQKSNTLWWVLGIVGGFVILFVFVVVGLLTYVGTVGPETSVYSGNQLPTRFQETIEEVGALEEGEKIKYFYSDGFTDIRNGFYFVSDRNVVIYSDQLDPALTVIPFAQIDSVHLSRDESFFLDSEITVMLEDGAVYNFPVSSEYDRDSVFFQEIKKHVE